jgi:hypothetical protein
MKSRISMFEITSSFWTHSWRLSQFFLLLRIVGLRDRHDLTSMAFSAHYQNVQPGDLLDGHRSRLCVLSCYELGLAELVAKTKNIAKGKTKAKTKAIEWVWR